MKRKRLAPPKLQPAPKGSKVGFVTVSGQVSPEVAAELDHIAQSRTAYRSELVRVAVEQFVQREAA